MAHNKLYRNFIILQEDERGYSHSNDKALSGYAKVEAKGDKCKVSFYAQNLRQEDNYSMVLICCKRDLKQLIDLGPLSINGVGKGDTSKDYYVNNIAGLGMSYEKISGAAICKVKDNETEFIMHGFMNGEDSSDNWRRFKIVKVDSKKYINKLDEEPKKKDISSLYIADKAIISKSNNVETKIVETSKLESGLVERKKNEKENIELETLNNDNSKVEDKHQNRIIENKQNTDEAINVLDEDRNKCKEAKQCDKFNMNENMEDKHQNRIIENKQNIDEAINILDEDRNKCKEAKQCDKPNMNENIEDKQQNRISENNQNIDEAINILDEDRNKCKEVKKCGKCEKNEHIEETKKCDKHEMNENIEEAINKVAQKLETYDGVIDLRISNVHEDVIIYGFIKDKKNCDCKWKKFKVEKKCRNENQDFNNIQANSKRIEENFKLDKLNESDRIDRLDIIDFDEYENDIQQAGTVNIDKTSTGDMGEASTGTVDEKITANIDEKITGNMCQTSTGTVGQTGLGTMWQPIWQPTPSNMQQSTSNQGFNISGEVGQYFEKLAEGFEPYKGNLADINYCKLYKINVNSIEDLSDESNYNQYTLAYYPMLNYYPYIRKEGYFLLGYKCNGNGEMKYIVYAIPGSKDKNEQPYGGRTGFVTWTSDNTNGRGYWLMFYDFKNSSIVIPTK